jgi:phosphoserine phosphatase
MAQGKLYDYGEKSLTLRQWASELGLDHRYVRRAIDQGWFLEDVVKGRPENHGRRGRTVRRWTDEELATMGRMRSKGESARDIALALDRTPGAVNQRIRIIDEI